MSPSLVIEWSGVQWNVMERSRPLQRFDTLAEAEAFVIAESQRREVEAS